MGVFCMYLHAIYAIGTFVSARPPLCSELGQNVAVEGPHRAPALSTRIFIAGQARGVAEQHITACCVPRYILFLTVVPCLWWPYLFSWWWGNIYPPRATNHPHTGPPT